MATTHSTPVVECPLHSQPFLAIIRVVMRGLPRVLLMVWQKWWPQHKDTGLTRTARNKAGKINSLPKYLDRSKIWGFKHKDLKTYPKSC